MSRLRTQVTVEAASLKAEDAQVNVWHFATPDAWVAGDLTDVAEALHDFYLNMAAWCSSVLFSGNIYVKFYDLEDPEPRAPVGETTLAWTGLSSGSSCPPEVSCCVSFEGLPESGVNQARRRGRIYAPTMLANRLSTRGSWSEATVDGIAAGAAALLLAANTAANWNWIVYSRVAEDATVVERGWVDAAVDIQRRRGRVEPYRELFV
jgi:hypothetical protein